MNAPAHHDPYLELPLEGVRLIEASAGTGKTFTLATLVTRLVVERGLRIGQVLAVTFTDAATQELRSRIRERLDRAAALVDAPPAAGETPEDALSRGIVERHLAGGGETRAQLARRLRQAALEIDLAAIFTIHGFCARVLRDCALESGHGFDGPTLLTSDAALREELAADLWRSLAADPDAAPLLPRLWKRPKDLQDDLRALLSYEPLRPEPPVVDGPDPTPALERAARALCTALAEHGEAAWVAIERAFDSKVFDGRRARRQSFEKAWATLCRGSLEAGWSRSEKDHLDKLASDRLRELCKAGSTDKVPCSPVFDALEGWLRADDEYTRWLDARSTALLHRVRDEARERLAELKRARRLQTYDDLIDGVADALDGDGGEALVAALRAQYRFALVDEFQDTDPRQWAIFRRVFGEPHGDPAGPRTGAGAHPPALFLIGDPKQAIYGFRGGDVHTYLQAKAVAAPAPPLDRNFRSRPAVLRAIAALYESAERKQTDGGGSFLDPRISFQPVQPGGRREDAAFLRDGVPAPALTLRAVDRDPRDPAATAFDADRSRELATRACVAAIHALLVDARAGRATIDGDPLQPGDIAVLVRRHHEATRIQHALAAAGIPAVAAGRQSLFATDEAHELLALFEALVHPADDSRLRTALATVLVGLDAAAVAVLDSDGAAHARWQGDAQLWRERWQRSGPLALVADLCAAAGERLLGLLDGERRLTNTLQLAELMQDAQAHAPGLHGQLDWLRTAIAEADSDDEAQLLRLESDARRVQIVTLHKSKGLEYPVVYLPFAGIGGKPATPDRHCTVHDGDARVRRWKIDKDDPGWRAACAAHKREQAAEDARLLYVGLTRARHALWLATGPFHGFDASRLAPMLADRDALRDCADIALDDAPLPPPPVPLPPADEGDVPPARTAARVLSRDWWVYSFTQLARDGAEEPRAAGATATAGEGGAEDEPVDAAGIAAIEPAMDELPFDPRFAGSRFGNVLHDAFEHVDFGAWRGWQGGAAPDGEEAPLRQALLRGGYAGGDLDDGVALLRTLVGHSLVATLPEGGRLCELPPSARRAEMEFHFALQPTAVDALVALLHRHGVFAGRAGFGARRRLEGLMTGKIDLTYTAGGRWYVLDYKSNRLPAYDAPALDAAMAHSGYDLQALIYTLALHRWLRFRLDGGYDYARDFGGVRYLFCRGLAQGAGAGIHAHLPSSELVLGLDALFAGGAR